MNRISAESQTLWYNRYPRTNPLSEVRMMDYNVIDSDGHICEPPDLWEHYIDPKFREGCPKLVTLADGTEILRIEGDVAINLSRGKQRISFGAVGAIGAREGKVSPRIPYTEGRKGGFDPHARIPDMDAEGIDAAVLYPSLGLFLGAIKDPEFAAAACRAYNRWLADYCKPYPERLFGAAMLPMQSIEGTIQEMRYAMKELGFRAGFIRPNPYNGRVLHDPDYDPLWTEAQDLGFSIGIHGGSESGQPTLAMDRFKQGGAVRHCVAHTFEMMAAATSLIMCGVCDRFPRLKVAFLESGGGWMAGWLDRMDRHFDDVGMNDTELSTRPSEIFRRQCFISFEPVEKSLSLLADYLGSDNILWATDYPHLDGFIGAPQMIKAMGLPPQTLANVLAGGAKRYYGLQ
ncbi:MAG TPA: amidohydrolase family protein [Candidatus Binatia bacterium]|nr:amidohydrolase family protein [Candidatus Binatia bacterium]